MRLLHLLIIFFLFACTSSKQEESTTQTIDSIEVTEATDKKLVTEEIRHQEVSPIKIGGDIQILFTGTFHGDEVNEGADKLNWFGLFNEDGNYFLRRTKIITDRVVDG